MANISLIDSGYVSVGKTGTQETLQSNSGSEITLKSVELTYGRGQNIDNTPIVGVENNATLNPVSVVNPVISVQGVLKRTVSGDMDKIILLDTLTRSKGLKLLYYNSTDDDISAGGDDGWNNFVSKLGAENLDSETNEAGDTIEDSHTQSGGELYNSGDPIPHLHVLVKTIKIVHSSDGTNLKFTLTCEVQ